MWRYSSSGWIELRLHSGRLIIGLLIPWTLLLSGCRPETPSTAETLGLAREYVDVDRDQDLPVVLQLDDDGTFIYIKGPRGRGEVAPAPASLAEGTWQCADGDLELRGDGWSASFAADSTWVEVPRGARMLTSLRWVTSSPGSPFSACNLVSRAEFEELLSPKAGTGSAQSAW
jgi:hypothetical protein